MKFKISFRTFFQGVVCFAMLSACGKQRFDNTDTGLVARNLNQFLSLSQADRSNIINQIGYDCGYTNQPTPVEGTSIIGATALSTSQGGNTGQYWIEPRLCLPVCRIFPMDDGGVVFGSASVQTNLQISIASLDGAVAKEELSYYYIGYCRPPGGCANVSGGGSVGGSSGGTATTIAAGLSCAPPPSLPPVTEPGGPIIPMPYPVPATPEAK